MSLDRAVSIHLSERDLEAIDKLAVLENRSRNELINAIIASHLWGKTLTLNLIGGGAGRKVQSDAE